MENSDIRKIIETTTSNVIKLLKENIINVEDFFDLNKIPKKEFKHLLTDLRCYLYEHSFNNISNITGKLLIKEEVGSPLPIKQLRKELQKFGFKQWQIKTTITFNKVRVVILLADIAKNIDVIESKMFEYGWLKAQISEPTEYNGVNLRVLTFDPKEQKSLTKEAKKYKYLYHWTPNKNVNSILKNGLEPRSENDLLSYPPKIHVMKGDITKFEATKLAWMLFNNNKSLKKGNYTLLRVITKEIPNNVEFYGDGRFEFGYFTNDKIPPNCIEIFGEINFLDKYNFNYETINVLVSDDTMLF